MSTRGIYGFIVNEKEKLAYNHFDSYPSGLGLDVLNAVKELTATPEKLAEFTARADAIEMIDQAIEDKAVNLNPQQLKNLDQRIANSSGDFSYDSEKMAEIDWYSFLRASQGNIENTLTAGYMIDSSAFVKDSLFCEYGYIVNLDSQHLEAYIGFQTQPHNDGCFASDKDSKGYYPIRLAYSFPFDKLPNERTFTELIEARDG